MSASQAEHEGSIPFTRSSVGAKSAQLRFRQQPAAIAENCAHSLAPPSKSEALGFGFVFSFARKDRSTTFPATACGYCRKLRSLPCASFQIRSTLASDLFFLLRTTYRSRRRFFFQNKRHLSLTSSLLLSKLNPLRWASIWVFFCKVRSTTFPA